MTGLEAETLTVTESLKLDVDPKQLRTEWLVRDERHDDRDAVWAINAAVFETAAEAAIVDALREHARPLVSLVAEVNGELVGHIMFSPVTSSEHQDLELMGLGPMAVKPAHQGQGVGSALVRAGLRECRQSGSAAVVVLGHPDYYPRFGFVPASRFGFHSKYDVPDDVFMLMELQPGALEAKAGSVSYHPAFDS